MVALLSDWLSAPSLGTEFQSQPASPSGEASEDREDDENGAQQPPDLAPEFDQPATLATEPLAPISSLLQQLDTIAAPAASLVIATQEPPAIETVQLTRASRSSSGNTGVRRAQVSIQPVIRGYQQQSVYGQYQGAQFLPVRFDLDSILTSIDPGIIDNLVIIPGPYGVKYGPGLAFIDVQATPLPRSCVTECNGSTKLLYHSNGKQFYGRETVTGSGPSYGARVSYGHKTGSDYFSGDNTQIPASYNVLDLDVAVALDVGSNSSLQFEYLLQNMTDTEFSGLVFDARQRETNAFFLRYDYNDAIAAKKLLIEGWYNRTYFDGDNLNPSKQDFYQSNDVFNPPGSFIGFTDADVTTVGGRISPTWGNDESGRLTCGVDFRYLEYELNEFDDFDFFGFENYPVPRSSIVDVGAFAELSLPASCDSTVTAGVRLDWVQTYQPAIYESVDPLGDIHIFEFDEVFNEVDMLYHAFVSVDRPISECLRIRAGVGHGQRPPNATERFAIDPFLTLVQNATSAVIGDPFLSPERGTQFDVALIGDFPDLRFKLSGFWSYLDEHITLAPDLFEVSPSPDLRLLDFVNNDSVLTGGDLTAELDLCPSLLSFATLGYVEGRNLVRHEPLPNIFPIQSRLGVRWHEPCEEIYAVEFSAWVVGSQDRIATSLLELPTPGFTRFDLRGHWQVFPTCRISFGIQNLTDVNYLEHLSVHNPEVLEPGLDVYVATEITY